MEAAGHGSLSTPPNTAATQPRQHRAGPAHGGAVARAAGRDARAGGGSSPRGRERGGPGTPHPRQPQGQNPPLPLDHSRGRTHTSDPGTAPTPAPPALLPTAPQGPTAVPEAPPRSPSAIPAQLGRPRGSARAHTQPRHHAAPAQPSSGTPMPVSRRIPESRCSRALALLYLYMALGGPRAPPCAPRLSGPRHPGVGRKPQREGAQRLPGAVVRSPVPARRRGCAGPAAAGGEWRRPRRGRSRERLPLLAPRFEPGAGRDGGRRSPAGDAALSGGSAVVRRRRAGRGSGRSGAAVPSHGRAVLLSGDGSGIGSGSPGRVPGDKDGGEGWSRGSAGRGRVRFQALIPGTARPSGTPGT